MSSQFPVGENRPPCSPAPQKEGPPGMPGPVLPPDSGDAPAGAQPAVVGTMPPGGAAPASKPRRGALINPTPADACFAAASFVLGYLFVFARWALLMGGWSETVLTFLYAGTTLAYLRAKGVRPQKESWFWLAILLLTGLSFALWDVSFPLALWRCLLLPAAAIYWAGSAVGLLAEKKTGNHFVHDAITLLFRVPLSHIGIAFSGLGGFAHARKRAPIGAKRTKPLRVLAGVGGGALACVPLLAIVVPMLLRADEGGFYYLVSGLGTRFGENLGRFLMDVLLGVPVAMYLAGLVMGGVHRGAQSENEWEELKKKAAGRRQVPLASAATVLGVVAVLYVVFIACQVPYFFRAFQGRMPGGYNQYSQYARDGFFELCRISALNLGLLACAGTLCKATLRESRLLRVLYQCVAVVSLVFLATALRKMVLYIQMHHFTPKRILTSVFMVFLAGVFVAAMLAPYRQWSVVRFAALYGAALLCALCLCNLDAQVMRLNNRLYASQPAEGSEVVTLRLHTAAEVGPAMWLYENGNLDKACQVELFWEIWAQCQAAHDVRGTRCDTLAARRARALVPPGAPGIK